MAKVFGISPIELLPGASGEEFAKVWIEEYAPLAARLGWIGHVLKADRGERAGKYMVIWEMESVESRNRGRPAPAAPITEEALQLLGPDFGSVTAKLRTYVDGFHFSDYVEIGE